MPTPEGPREFCAADAARDFALTLEGKRIQAFDGVVPGNVMKVQRVMFPREVLGAVYQVEGRMEDLPEGAHRGPIVWTIGAETRIRILEAGEARSSGI